MVGQGPRRSGSFEWPSEPGLLGEARAYFLEAVKRVEPQVLADLSLTPWHCFVPVADKLFPARGTIMLRYDPQGALISDLAARDTCFAALRDALADWGQKWNLNDPWCLDNALWTLHRWWSSPEDDPNHQSWATTSANPWTVEPPVSDDETRIVFEHEGWFFPWESRQDVKKRIITAFERYLDIRLDESADLFVTRGMVPVPAKGKLSRLECLAHYQVGKLSFPDIARKMGENETTVSQAVYDTCEWIGLSRRVGDPGGRPISRSRKGTRKPPVGSVKLKSPIQGKTEPSNTSK